MENLPIEVLHNIFTRISFYERLMCSEMCRQFYNVLSTRSLLYDIHIRTDPEFNEFISMLERLPGRRSQVEVFNLENCIFARDIRAFDKRKFCNMFPNLRVFQYKDTLNRDSDLVDHCKTRLPLEHRDSKLESLTDEGQCEFIRQWLTYGTCMRLKYLKLDLSTLIRPRKKIILQLVGAPNLTKLSLWYCNIGIEDLEIIHKSLPMLEKFDMSTEILVTAKPPATIIPATSVKSFELYMNNVKDISKYQNMFKYVGRKYTNLTRFVYSDDRIFLKDAIVTMGLYEDGLFPIYKKFDIPIPQYFFINVPIESNPFAVLDRSGVRSPKILLKSHGSRPIFEQLGRSNQAKHIEEMELSHTRLCSPTMLRHFSSLTKLTINSDNDFEQYDMNLGDLFNAIPLTLTWLSGSFQFAEIDEVPSYPNNIEHLDLSCVDLHSILGEVITTCCPKLNDLSLSGTVSENFTIRLPNNHLKKLCFEGHSDGDTSVGYAIMKSGRSQPEYYVANDSIQKALVPVTLEEVQNRVMIDLHFDNVDELSCYKPMPWELI